ncbi:MAG: prepilin peptidase [Archaeoglobus sp.]|jgi:preflagellin peptidase FlaK|nr:prepilin peptidase [Archaeoglobus sp.]
MNYTGIAEILKIFLVSIFLLYACHLDIKTRTVPNKVWKAMLALISPFLAYQVYHYLNFPFLLISSFAGVIFMVFLSYLLYAMNAYGGADAKALMCLSIAFPFYPELSPFLLNRGIGVFSFSVLANSVIFAPFIMVAILFRNLLTEGFKGFFKHPIYYVAGYRIPVEKIGFHNLFEFVDENGKLRRVRRAVESDREKILRLKKAGIEKVWVTPALPFIVFITFGFFVAIFFGDLVVALILTFS